MKLDSDFKVNIKTRETIDKIDKANKAGLTDVIVDIANDAIKGSPVLTGNNRRSIMYEVGPGKQEARNKNEAAAYSTSGYGGYLETGTFSMGARPYFKPALDLHFPKLPMKIKEHLT